MSKRYSDLSAEQKAARAEYYRSYHQRPDRIAKKRAKQVIDQKNRREKARAIILDAKRAPCADCGIVLPSEVMDLDHVRGVKRINLGKATRGRSYLSWEQLRAELLKCDVRCPNCHRLRHYHLAKPASDSLRELG